MRSAGGADFYEVEQREGRVEILPGRRTTVWGDDGIFPGPTFVARSGRRTVLRVRNSLTVPTVTHLHGGVTPPESDGSPTDRLPLPGGGRDIPLMLCDRSFEEDGSFRYPAHGHDHDAFPDGVLGDVQLVNGAPRPVLEVAATRYRFRLLNASNARRYRLRLEAEAEEEAETGRSGRFVQIGSDGGLLAAPQPLGAIDMAPGERCDVVADFADFPVTPCMCTSPSSRSSPGAAGRRPPRKPAGRPPWTSARTRWWKSSRGSPATRGATCCTATTLSTRTWP